MLTLYDGNSWLRVVYETDNLGIPLRTFYNTLRFSPDEVIVVWDGFKANERRREIYPGYKQRPPAPDDFYQSVKLMKAILGLTDIPQIECEGWEADDIIAKIVIDSLDREVMIYSTDGDFQQLKAFHPKLKTSREGYKNLKPEDIRLYKTLVGDTSDTIPGIPNFGEKAFALCDRDEFMEEFGHGLMLSDDPVVLQEKFNIKPGPAKWLAQKANQNLLWAYWRVVGFFEVPMSEFEKGIKVGRRNDQAVDEILRSVMQ